MFPKFNMIIDATELLSNHSVILKKGEKTFFLIYMNM